MSHDRPCNDLRTGTGPPRYGCGPLSGSGAQATGETHLQVYDPINARISLFEQDGTPSESWRIPPLWTLQAMWMVVGDETFIKFPTGPIEEGQSRSIGLLRIGADGGIMDTIPAPTIAEPPENPAGTACRLVLRDRTVTKAEGANATLTLPSFRTSRAAPSGSFSFRTSCPFYTLPPLPLP